MSKIEKMRKFKEYVSLHKISEKSYKAPLDKVLESLGLTVRPFILWNPFFSALLFGFISTLVFSILFCPFWKLNEINVPEGAFYSLITGTLSGIFIAIFNLFKRYKLKLPSWSKF